METSQSSASFFPTAQRNYVLSGKIMLSTIVILFAIVIFVLLLHVYARWFLLRRLQRRRRDRRHFVFAAEIPDGAPRRGLDREILKSLPIYTYKVEEVDSVECAVCLSELQEKEKFRQLHACKHRFHVECIDMWFDSHSNCPLCRAAVEIPAEASGSEPRSSSSSSSSSGPTSSGGACAEEEFKSPISRMKSLTRMLSIDLRFYRGSSENPDLEAQAPPARSISLSLDVLPAREITKVEMEIRSNPNLFCRRET